VQKFFTKLICGIFDGMQIGFFRIILFLLKKIHDVNDTLPPIFNKINYTWRW